MANVLKFPRMQEKAIKSTRKFLFSRIILSDSLNLTFSYLAALLGGVGGFSLNRKKIGVQHTVAMTASQNIV